MGLAALLCTIKLFISTGPWNIQECQVRAVEFENAGLRYNIDPELLVAISIYECDLDSYKDTVYRTSRGVEARDICPMGLHVKTNLEETRAGLKRQDVIYMAADLLAHYKKWHAKHCKKNHSYLQHYNTGYKHLENDYANNVFDIYNALTIGKKPHRLASNRTQEISYKIRQVLGKTKHEDYYKGCHTINQCSLASTKR